MKQGARGGRVAQDMFHSPFLAVVPRPRQFECMHRVSVGCGPRGSSSSCRRTGLLSTSRQLQQCRRARASTVESSHIFRGAVCAAPVPHMEYIAPAPGHCSTSILRQQCRTARRTADDGCSCCFARRGCDFIPLPVPVASILPMRPQHWSAVFRR